MSGGDFRERDIHSDAPRPGDSGPIVPDRARKIAERDDIPLEQRLRILQKMLAEASGEDAAERRREIRLALQMLGADVVTDENQPLEAPEKTGYSATGRQESRDG